MLNVHTLRYASDVEEPRNGSKKSVRSQLYRAARDLGNIEAASEGPTSFGKRYARRKVYAKTNGFTRKLLRTIGLSK